MTWLLPAARACAVYSAPTRFTVYAPTRFTEYALGRFPTALDLASSGRSSTPLAQQA